MKVISRSYSRFYQILCLLLALHFLNLSIDSPDRHPDHIPENLSYNDIESFTEFLAEIIFGWDNAFKEHEERDGDNSGAQDFYKFYCSNPSITVADLTPGADPSKKFPFGKLQDILSPPRDVSSPPPEA